MLPCINKTSSAPRITSESNLSVCIFLVVDQLYRLYWFCYFPSVCPPPLLCLLSVGCLTLSLQLFCHKLLYSWQCVINVKPATNDVANGIGDYQRLQQKTSKTEVAFTAPTVAENEPSQLDSAHPKSSSTVSAQPSLPEDDLKETSTSVGNKSQGRKEKAHPQGLVLRRSRSLGKRKPVKPLEDEPAISLRKSKSVGKCSQTLESSSSSSTGSGKSVPLSKKKKKKRPVSSPSLDKISPGRFSQSSEAISPTSLRQQDTRSTSPSHKQTRKRRSYRRSHMLPKSSSSEGTSNTSLQKDHKRSHSSDRRKKDTRKDAKNTTPIADEHSEGGQKAQNITEASEKMCPVQTKTCEHISNSAAHVSVSEEQASSSFDTTKEHHHRHHRHKGKSKIRKRSVSTKHQGTLTSPSNSLS